jgi:hypothetical protein
MSALRRRATQAVPSSLLSLPAKVGMAADVGAAAVRGPAAGKMGLFTVGDGWLTNVLDSIPRCFRSGSSAAQRRSFSMRQAAAGARGRIRAGFEMDAR